LSLRLYDCLPSYISADCLSSCLSGYLYLSVLESWLISPFCINCLSSISVTSPAPQWEELWWN
jgi:hypothetical protein